MRKLTILLLTAAMSMTISAQQKNSPTSVWEATWATAIEFTGPSDMPASSLSNRAIRQIIHVSKGGTQLQLKLSNVHSKEPVDIKSVFIADAKEASDIDAKTAKYVTFNGKRSITIEPGKDLTSDVIGYNLKPLQLLSITINYGESTPVNASSHRGSRTTSYIIKGVAKPKTKFIDAEKVDHWYNIASLDVLRSNPAEANAIVVLGNSITDGRGSTTNKQNRWTDAMAEALGGETSVLNLGIGGNSVLWGGLSEPAVKRFNRDILEQQGVKTLIIFQGVNDIGGSRGNSEEVAKKLTEAYKSFIDQGHARGWKVIGATITPFKGNSYYSFFHEAARQVVNEWIRTSGAFDAVIDFDELVRDPQDPTKLKAEYSDDWLHLNPTGYAAMGKLAAKVYKR
ncbi:MAG: SGNH/GDSL hydrolase family protein [Prevotellaceae bacterium]|nr:SGNH/GDSL hydrolase family protein [Prevotellaceae bacterium]